MDWSSFFIGMLALAVVEFIAAFVWVIINTVRMRRAGHIDTDPRTVTALRDLPPPPPRG